jgi:lysophospholipase L1-like esterase
VCEHIGSCVYNLANVGRALGWVDAWLGVRPDSEFIVKTLGPTLNGYCAECVDEGQPSRRTLRFQRKGVNEYEINLEDFRRKLEEFRKEPTGAPPNATALTLFRRIVRMSSELHARPIFVTLPALYIQSDLLGAHALGEVPDLLEYHDPDLHPDLYAPDNREDQTHLNAEGARLFTEKLARDFVELVKRSEPRQ